MKIDSVEAYRVSMPLIYPFRTSFGNDDCIESVLVLVRSGSSYGWGEASPWQRPNYCAESAATAMLVIREYLAPLVVGREFESGIELQEAFSPIRGNFFAKAAIDLAWWDLYARQQDLPLYQVLGGKRSEIEVGADFGIMDSIPQLIETIETAVQEGFKRVKLKYRPGWDLPMIATVREHFPTLPIHVDCNSAYTLSDLANLKQLDAFNLTMLEQPLMCDDLIDHATLQKEIRTPICLDESITSVDRARKAIDIGACGWINIKAGRVGGLTPAVAIHDLCARNNIPCWVGGMLESSVGAHHCLALASLENFRYPADIFPTTRFYHRDIGRPAMRLSGPSLMTLEDTPGCGAEPDPEMLEKQTLDHFCVR